VPLARLQAPRDPTPDDAKVFVRHARAVVEEFANSVVLGMWGGPATLGSPDAIAAFLSQVGADASIVLSEHRWPGASAAGVREGLFEVYDRRLSELSRVAAWVGGRA
jgi:hypothetical protein